MTSGLDGSEEALIGRGGIRLWVRHDAPPKEPIATLVLVHGWGEHQGRYRELAQSMTEWGLSVWGFDLRGHGKSGGRRGHVDRFGDFLHDLVQVVEHARGLETHGQPLLLLGHSMGGLILLRALQKGDLRPAAACVSAPWLKTAIPVPAWKTALVASLERLVPALPVPNRLNPELLTADPVKIRQHQDDPLIHGWMTPRCFVEVERAQRQVLEEMKSLALPILFLIPGDDPVVDAGATTHFVRRTGGSAAQVVDVAGSRHEPFNEVDRKARFDEVGGFFTGVLDSDRQDMDEME